MKKMSIKLRLALAMIVGLSGILSANAGTVGYWRFEGGTSGNTIATAASEVNSPAMDGSQWDSNEANVLYSSDVAGAYIYDPVTSEYSSNVVSMLAPAGASTDDSQIMVNGMSALGGSFTLEMFVKVEDEGGAANFPGGKYNRVFNLDGSSSCYGSVGSAGSGTTLLKFICGGKSITDYSSYLDFQDGLWHHLAYVIDYDGTNTRIELFVDYGSVGSSSFSGQFVNDDSLRFGVSSANISNFDWFFDDVRLSDGVLMSDEFLQVADQAPGTAGYWRFEGGTSGTEIVTATSEVNSPAMDGSQWSSNETNVLYSSDVAGAYIYDPVTSQYNSNTGSMHAPASASTDNSQILVNDMSALSGSFTLEMFVKVEDEGGAANFPGGAYNRVFNLDGGSSCYGSVGSASSGTTLLKYICGGQTINDYSSHPDFQDGLWHHLAYVTDYNLGSDTTTIEFFMDYASVGSTSFSGKFVNDSNDGLRFGISSANISDFDWFLDDVRLSDSALMTNQFLQVSDEDPTHPTIIAVVSGSDFIMSWGGGESYTVLTNADLTHTDGWGVSTSGTSPMTNAIGSEAVLFYVLSE